MLEQIVHRVEAKLFAFLRDHQAERADEIDALNRLLLHQQTEFDRRAQHRDELRQRLTDHEITAALLPSQIENSLLRCKSAQAMRQALELERIRQELAATREELPRLEQTCWSLSFRLRGLKRQLARLLATE